VLGCGQCCRDVASVVGMLKVVNADSVVGILQYCEDVEIIIRI